MELREIKSLLGGTIYSLAEDYYRSGMIREIDKTGPGRLIAFVEGSSYNSYKVEIDIKDDIIDCNCPYHDICKHIGAVLIHQHHHDPGFFTGISAGSALMDLAGSIDKARIELDSKEKKVYHIDELRKKKENFRLFPEEVNVFHGQGERYSLVLIIEKGERWEPVSVSARARFIKKDGSFGRMERFTPKKITEPADRTALALARELNRWNNASAPLSEFFDIILDRPDLFFFRNDRELLPLRLINLRDYYFYCDLETLLNDKILFDIKLARVDRENREHTVSLKNLERHHFRHYGIAEPGELVYYGSNPELFRLIERLKALEQVTLSVINALEEYCGKMDPPIDVRLPYRNLQVLSSSPRVIIEMEERRKDLYAAVTFDYGGSEVRQSGSPRLIYIDFDKKTKTLTLMRTEPEYENLEIIHIRSLLQNRLMPPSFRNSFYYPEGPSKLIFEDCSFIELISEFGKAFVDRSYEIRLKDSNITLSSRSGDLVIFVESGIDWFDCTVKYRMDDEEEARAIELDTRLLLRGIVKSGDSYHVLSREEIERLTDLYREGLSPRGKIRIPRCNLFFIEKLYREAAGDDRKLLEERAGIYRKLINIRDMPGYVLPKKFKTKLRKYQKEGYHWLMFLHAHGLNGCLADDMGLGKTVQCLAVLQKLKEEGSLGTSLLVVPVSTIANWISEIERFTAGMTVCEHMGTPRIKEAGKLLEYDLIITSYHTLSRDMGIFSSIDFHYLVLDESQYIKNSATLNFKSVRSINARSRLSLTGTPVENSSRELWSQMDFLNPGLLGSKKVFQDRFARAIEKANDPGAAEKLRKKTAPFILRRKKDEVAPDLPDREEIIYHIEMGPRQGKFYDTLRKEYQSEMKRTLEEEFNRNWRAGGLHEIFVALLRLRQAALMPRLIDKKFTSIGSCKFDALKEMVGEIIAEDHKVLIFSQFVKVLDVLREHFDEEGTGYSCIDGSTRKRAEEIRRFQEDDNRKLFLLSLKAGGVGINLTAADYVIIFDPWWNPAVEAQAIDRSHRIGQTRKVIAYKYIVKNTIEEKMLELQRKKQKLVDDIISDEPTLLSSLSRDEIMELFS